MNSHPLLLQKGSKTFRQDIAYRVYSNEKSGEAKPLILYLHGFGDTIDGFATTCHDLVVSIDAYHLFLQGPYLLYDRKRKNPLSKWGRYWYHYDGDEQTFLQSLKHTSTFIAELLDDLSVSLNFTKKCVLGFSMGGYQAGAFSFLYPNYVNELIVAGCRLKSEILGENMESVRNLSILGLHGKHDKVVDFKPQKREMEELSSMGLDCHFQLFEEKHIFSCNMREAVCNWLITKGYQINS